MRKWIPISVLLLGWLCGPPRAIAQESDVTARIVVHDLGERKRVEGACYNHADEDRTLRYEFWVIRTDPDGNSSRSAQSGEVEVGAGQTQLLAATTLNTRDEDDVMVNLMIYKGEKRIAADSLKKWGAQPTPEAPAPQPEQPDLPEPGGFIFDETRTRAGHDFYDRFYNQWEAPAKAGNFTIRIEELPFRLRMTQIRIFLNDLEIFQQYLLPNQNYIEELATYAVNLTQHQLENFEQLQRDLEGEDVQGTGIY